MKRLRKTSFGNSTVKSMLFSSLLMLLVTYVSTVSSTLIAGKIVGHNALCAINLVSPLQGYVNFIAGLIGIGSSLSYFRNMGANQKEQADRMFSQGVIFAVAAGILICIAMILGKDAYLNSLEVSEAIRMEAEQYWKYEKFVMALLPFDFLLFELLFPDTRRIMVANIVLYVVGIGSSIILTSIYGTMGASLGMTIGIALCDLVLCTHFVSKKNEFKFIFHVSLKDTKEVIRLSLVDSSTYLDNSLLVAFINYYVIRRFSENMLPIAAAMVTILDMVVIFDSVGSAFAPVAEVYLGEENYQDEKEVAKYSLSVSMIFGILAASLFMISAPLFPKFFEIDDPIQANILIKSVRLFSPSLLFYSISYMMISHYIAIRKVALAVIFEWTKAFIMPALCILLFGNLFGFTGIWGSFIFAEMVSTVGIMGIIRFIFGKEKSIWILDNGKYPVFSKSYRVNADAIITARDDIEQFLMKNQINRSIINKMMITVEEMTDLVMEHNWGRKVIMQYNVSIRDEYIYLYERDNGNMYDLSDSDKYISNFNEYIFSCVIDFFDYKQHLLLVDYNRNIFHYKLS